MLASPTLDCSTGIQFCNSARGFFPSFFCSAHRKEVGVANAGVALRVFQFYKSARLFFASLSAYRKEVGIADVRGALHRSRHRFCERRRIRRSRFVALNEVGYANRKWNIVAHRQKAGIADVGAALHRGRDRICQRRRVGQAQVHALARQRVHRVRRIAYQRHPPPHIPAAASKNLAFCSLDLGRQCPVLPAGATRAPLRLPAPPAAARTAQQLLSDLILSHTPRRRVHRMRRVAYQRHPPPHVPAGKCTVYQGLHSQNHQPTTPQRSVLPGGALHAPSSPVSATRHREYLRQRGSTNQSLPATCHSDDADLVCRIISRRHVPGCLPNDDLHSLVAAE